MNPNEPWRVSKEIPLALIVTLALQVGVSVWWLSTLNNRVEVIEQRLAVVEDSRDRLIRLEVAAEHQSRTLDTLVQRLDDKPASR